MNYKEEYDKLKKELQKHNKAYYQEANPIISDFDYDKLYQRLLILEAQYPELKSKDSPSEQVGETVQGTFSHVSHRIPMLSLDNTYSENELRKFLSKVEEKLPANSVSWSVEPKIDGISINLRYEKGIFVLGSTRGDGTTGDDVTLNLKTLKQVPLFIKHVPDIFEVRGEVYLPHKEFNRLNAERELNGLSPFANPRNAAAGSLKLLDSTEVQQRGLDIFLYALGEVSPEALIPETQIQLLDWFKEIGLPISPYKYCKNQDEIITAVNDLEKSRKTFGFDTDGAVIKLNEFKFRDPIGYTAKAPRWAIAYKYLPEQAETILKSISLQIGRTGIISPVAELEPVKLSGSIIRRATLHNENYIQNKDIRIGDHVIIFKAGEVIPAVLKSLPEKRTGKEIPFIFPKTCPSCNTLLIQRGIVGWSCPNEYCFDQIKTKIEYWCSKNAMDIFGGGKGLILKLVSSGLVKDIADLYTLTLEQISPLLKKKDTPLAQEERLMLFPINPFSQLEFPSKQEENLSKSAKKFLDSLIASKKQDLWRLLTGLGFSSIGTNTAKILAKNYMSLDQLEEASAEEIAQIPGIGMLSSQNIFQWFRIPTNIKLKQRLRKLGINFYSSIYDESNAIPKGPIAGKTFRLLNSLPETTKVEIISLAQKYGGIFKTSPNSFSNTHFFIISEQTDLFDLEEIEKATTAGTKIIKASQFKGLIEDAQNRLKYHKELYNKFAPQRKHIHPTIFSDTLFAITGSFSTMSRNDLKLLVEQYGGKITSSISKKVNYFLMGTKPTSYKVQKAKELNIPILSESDFMILLDKNKSKQ